MAAFAGAPGRRATCYQLATVAGRGAKRFTEGEEFLGFLGMCFLP